MSNFATIISNAFTSLTAVAGVQVEYWRGTSYVMLTAVPGSSKHQLADNDGALLEWRSRDYILSAADLCLSGSQTEPAVGDIIKERQGAKIYQQLVGLPQGGESCFRYSDTSRSQLRVHTVNQGAVNA